MSAPVWFITGASSGFGREMAQLALQRGHTVVATARSASRVQDLAALGADPMSFDVTSPLESIRATAKAVIEKHGRVDYLINAAGFLLEGAVEEASPEEVYQSFNVNVFGVMNTVKAFLPYLRAQSPGTNSKRATIVTFGSLASWEAGPSYAVYAMTKTSASMLAESLRLELSTLDIQATVIEPGYFRTAFLNDGVVNSTKERIDVYEDPKSPAGMLRNALTAVNNHQLGDPVKGARVAVDILTQMGVGAGKEVPVRIVLGPDCDAAIKKKITETTAILDEWQDVINSTNHDDVE